MSRVVHFFLTGGPLTWQYQRAISSARVHGDGVVLWYTGDRPSAQHCVVWRATVPDWLNKSDPQVLFNYLSLATLYEHGGMALGLDSISLQYAWDLLPEGKQLAVALGAPHLGWVAANGHVYTDPFNTDYIAVKGAEPIPAMLEEMERCIVDREWERRGVTPGGISGPLLLTRFVLDNPDTVAQVPFPALCGWEYSEAWRFYADEAPPVETRVIQLYASGYPVEYEKRPLW